MTCRELNDFLAEYLDGELAAPQREAFEGHLRLCPDCVRYLDDYREVIRLGGLCGTEEEPPADVPEELIRAVLAARAAG